jgi:preprotein translocase subunit SecA
MFKNILQTLAGNPYERELGRYKEIVERINALEPAMQARADDELRALTAGFREEMAEATAGMEDDLEERRAVEREVMDDILPEAFAAVREASVRTIGLRHYDVQLIGGIALHEGKIAEMKTGEGKTLVASLPLYLNALTGRGGHLVTVNDYLARRDGGWMGPIFHLLGLMVGVIGKERASAVYDPEYVDPGGDLEDERLVHWRPTLRQECYQAAVTYGTASEFGFDYLRDNTATDPARLVQREHIYAIVDEVDSVLIDGARTPLIISGPAERASDMYQRFAGIVEHARLRRNTTDLRHEEADGDYDLDERTQTVSLTDRGIEKIERQLSEIDVDAGESLYDPQYYDLVHYLENAIKAKYNFQRDVDYIVQNERVILVDQTTGRPMPSRRYSEGLHQAIEAKEGVHVRREDVTIATITVQNYFRMYDKLAGMTGTAVTQAEEFDEVYELDVIAIPTNVEYQAQEGVFDTEKEKVGQVMPSMAAYEDDDNYPIIVYRFPEKADGPDFFKRVDFPDQVYMSIDGKFGSVTHEIKELVEAGRPILVGTGSVDASEELSRRLKKMGLAHEVLNAKNHQREALIVAQAGRSGAVTISTSMAGRGTDILLGGNPEGLAAKFLAETLFDVEAFGEIVAHVVNGDYDAARQEAKSARAMDEALVDWIDETHDDLIRKAAVEDILGAVVEDVHADPAYETIPYETLVKLTQQVNLANIDARRMERARHMAEEADIPLSLIPDLQYRLDEYRSLSGLLGQTGLIETLTRLLFEKHYNARAALVRAVLADDLDEAKRITRTIPSLPESLIGEIQAIREDCRNDRQTVWQAGGLHVIGTERHEARRIDDQLRGRAARQGDPGSSRFYLSLEDELMLRFGGDRTKRLMERLNIPEDMPISANMLSNAIEQAQGRFESYNFEIRKNLVEYDEAVNRQREIVYDERHQILLGDAGDLDGLVRRFMAETLERAIARLRDNYEGWALGEVQNTMSDFSNVETGEVNTRGVIQRTLSLYPRPDGEMLEDLLAIEDDDELVEALHDLILDGMDEGHHLHMLYAEIARTVPLWPVLPAVGAGGIEGWDAFMRRLEEVFGRYAEPLAEAEQADLWDELREALEAARREFTAGVGKGTKLADAHNRLQNRMGVALRRAYEVPLADLEIEQIVEALLVRVDDLLATARLSPDGTDGGGDGDRVRAVERKLYAIGQEELAEYERALMLNAIDQEWRQYLTAIDDLRQGANLEAFGQRDPKVQFKRRAFEMFDALRADVEEGIARQFFSQLPRHRQIIEQREQQEKLLDNLATLGYRVERKVSRDSAGRVQVSQTVHKDLWSNVGRNDPCPCGSGKKFKDCHYREIQKQRSTVGQDEIVRGPSRRRRR